MNKLKLLLLEMFFPARCAVCDRLGSFLCPDCASEIIFIKEQTCPGCNRVYPSGKYCPKCRRNKNLKGIRSATYFKNENVKKLIHELKYRGYFAIAPTLAESMVNVLDDLDFDFISFVPTSKKRLRKRGYNQAEELAKAIAEMTERPILGGLNKNQETKTQVGLKKKEREKNLKDAFCYSGCDLKNKKIILVDDVKTTGATLNFCAKALKKSGAKEVWGIVFAKE